MSAAPWHNIGGGGDQAPSPRRGAGTARGLTLIEMAAALAVTALLAASAAWASAKYLRKDRARLEASLVADGLWELRAAAVAGRRNPCMDFPDSLTVRMYGDTSAAPDGFGSGDAVLRTWAYRGGVKARSLAGGSGPTHHVCFGSRGMMGSAGAALRLELAADDLHRRTVSLLPATGVARVR